MYKPVRNVALVFALVAGVLFAAPAVYAQSELERFDRQLEQIYRETRLTADTDVPTDQRLLLEYGGFLSFNIFAVDDPNQETHILRQTDLTGYLHANLDGAHDFLIRVSTRYDDYNTGDSFDTHGDDWTEPTLDRAIYTFDLARHVAAYDDRILDWNLTVQGGRQLVHWANGLVLSEELDGVLLSYTKNELSIDALAGVTRPSTTDIDNSRPDFDGDTHRGFFGGMVSYQLTPRHQPYVYGLVQRDYNDDQTVPFFFYDAHFDYNSHYIGIGSRGNLSDRLLYAAELVYEGGDTLSDPIVGPQTRDRIEAFAADVQLDYLLNDANRTRFSGELTVATGDDDRRTASNTVGGNFPGTKDRGFNGFGLINSGLAFAPQISNLVMVRVGASTFPLSNHQMFENLQVGVNLFVFNKFDSNAPIDEPTDTSAELGYETDLFVNWQVTSDVYWATRYGVFFPGGAIGNNLAPNDRDPRHFFYTGITLAF